MFPSIEILRQFQKHRNHLKPHSFHKKEHIVLKDSPEAKQHRDTLRLELGYAPIADQAPKLLSV